MSLWQEILAEFHIPIPSLTWRPAYEPVYLAITLPDGSTQKYLLGAGRENVTAETAEHLRAIYNPKGTVEDVRFLGPGGPVSGNPYIRWLVWPNKVQIIASAIAAVFDSYPLDPHVADEKIREILALRGAA